MRNLSLGGQLGAMLHRCKRLEASMRQAGLPAFLACLPLWLLALHHCTILREKTLRITRICKRIGRWQATVARLSAHEAARSEFIDLDHGMRDDIAGAADSMRNLRELCLEVCEMFAAIGYTSSMLGKARQRFSEAVDQACAESDVLIKSIDQHDRRALAVRQQQHAIEQASAASAAAHAARNTGQTQGSDPGLPV